MDTGSDSDPHDRSGAGDRPDHADRADAAGDPPAGRAGTAGSADPANSTGKASALPAYPGYPPPLGEARYLTHEELQRSLDRTLACQDTAAGLWLFGYGSLIWNPGMPAIESVRARVHGYHRGLYLWSRVNRGTPETPGLVLALDRGGSCPGVAFQLAAQGARAHLEALWQREMAMGSYRPAWLPCSLDDGRRVSALSFVMRREALTYTGKLSDELIRHVMQCASGRYGTTHDYVTRTVAALRESGMPDRALEDLLRRCG
jgi:glutathione-specific gamma-glutamylcyclotransferase